MRDHSQLGPWIRRFLLEHLVADRNLARNTQVSYRDTLALLLPFVSRGAGVAIEQLAVAMCLPTESGCSWITSNATEGALS